MRRSMFVAALALAGGSLALCGAASAQQLPIADGLDNPRPRYFDYHPPDIFYGSGSPTGYDVSGYVAAAPAYGASGFVAGYGPAYGYTAQGLSAPAAVPAVPVVRPVCGVFRYWRDGRCVDRRGY